MRSIKSSIESLDSYRDAIESVKVWGETHIEVNA
jgi:hypothetical protein